VERLLEVAWGMVWTGVAGVFVPVRPAIVIEVPAGSDFRGRSRKVRTFWASGMTLLWLT
jgi:hypothetical protein